MIIVYCQEKKTIYHTLRELSFIALIDFSRIETKKFYDFPGDYNIFLEFLGGSSNNRYRQIVVICHFKWSNTQVILKSCVDKRVKWIFPCLNQFMIIPW